MKPNKKTKDAMKEAREMKEDEILTSDDIDALLFGIKDLRLKKIKERKPTGKLDKETFIIVMNLIIEQDKLNEKLSDAIGLVNSSWTILEPDKFMREAAWQLLEVYYDNYSVDNISWFLYEDVEKIITHDSGKKNEKQYHLKTLGDLYDYIEKYRRMK